MALQKINWTQIDTGNIPSGSTVVLGSIQTEFDGIYTKTLYINDNDMYSMVTGETANRISGDTSLNNLITGLTENYNILEQKTSPITTDENGVMNIDAPDSLYLSASNEFGLTVDNNPIFNVNGGNVTIYDSAGNPQIELKDGEVNITNSSAINLYSTNTDISGDSLSINARNGLTIINNDNNVFHSDSINGTSIYGNGNAEMINLSDERGMELYVAMTSENDIKAPSFTVTDGTSSQFLKADGSLDSNEYQLTQPGTLNTQAPDIVGAINEVNSIAKGAQKVVSYPSYSDLVDFLVNQNVDYNSGQSIYIEQLNVPDLWVLDYQEFQDYTYVSDEQFLIDIQIKQIGKYNLRELETAKVDLTDYIKYTGATGDVNLGVHNLEANQLSVDLGSNKKLVIYNEDGTGAIQSGSNLNFVSEDDISITTNNTGTTINIAIAGDDAINISQNEIQNYIPVKFNKHISLEKIANPTTPASTIGNIFVASGDTSLKYQTSSSIKTVAMTSDIPTTLPASDVYSWAKASVKPTYIASEVGSYTTGETNSLISNYLPLSGGTLTGNLTTNGIQTITSNFITNPTYSTVLTLNNTNDTSTSQFVSGLRSYNTNNKAGVTYLYGGWYGITNNSTGTYNKMMGLQTTVTNEASGLTSSDTYGLISKMYNGSVNGSSAHCRTLLGVDAYIYNYGQTEGLTCYNAYMEKIGTVNSVGNNAAVVGLRVGSPDHPWSGLVSADKLYGIYIHSSVTGGAVDNYSIWSDTVAKNYFKGNTSIGMLPTTNAFEVSGNTKFNGNVTGNTFVTSGGTSSQFVKGNGSLDNNTYLTTSGATITYLPLSGGTLTGSVTGTTISINNLMSNTSSTTGLTFTNTTGGTIMTLDTINNYVGIGKTPVTNLDVLGSGRFGNQNNTFSAGNIDLLTISQLTDMTKDAYGLQVQLDVNPNVSNSRLFYGSYYNVTSTATAYNIGRMVGLQGTTKHKGSGTVSELRGTSATIYNQSTGIITNMHGSYIYAENTLSGGSITNLYGVNITSLTNAGTITNTYGIYIGDWSSGTQTNTPYSIYSSDENTYNYFAGNVGINNTTPTEKLSVNGNVAVSGGTLNLNSVTMTGMTTGSTPYTVHSIVKTSCNAIYYDYFVKETLTNAFRSGTVMAVQDGTSITYTETSTADLNASTSGISLSVQISGSNVVLIASITSGTYNISCGIRKI